MRNTFLKRAVGVALALTMTLSAIPLSPRAVATSDSGNETFTNPVMYADVPDVDVIRVDDAYYMVSTTMHLSPGCPVMKSTDLVNWETVSYTYDILDDGDKFALRNGESDYGSGSWAASIRHYNGKYYVSFASLSTGKTYIFSTTDVENGTWHRSEFSGYLHDVSLLTTQDDGMYVVYGSGTARCRPVYEDENGDITLGDEVTLIEYTGLDNDGNPVNGPVSYISEGIHAYEIGDYYYLFMIQWPTGGRRQEVCWRASSLDGPWESRKVFDSGLEFDGQMDNAGVAQGGIVQAADGSWYAMLFQDHSSVGRIPVLVPVTWEDGWPVFGDENGQAPVEMDLPGTYTGEKDIVVSDEFYNGQPHSFAADNSSVSTTADTATQNAAAVEAQPTADQEAERMELIVNGGFEDGSEPWTTQESATLELVTEEAYSGSTSLKVSDRTDTASGPKQDLTGQLTAGQQVEVTAHVKYNEGPDSKTFNLCIQCGDWTGIDVAASVTAQKGEWATITGTYTIPEDADMSSVGCFIETAWTSDPDPVNDLFDFYVDDVSVTVEAEEPGYGIIVNGGFENGSEPWAVQEASTLEIVTEEAFSGSYSAKISDRTNTASGPKQVLTGQLIQGQKVQVSAKVKYNDGPASKTFNFCIQCGDWRGIDVVGSVTAQKGQWATITGTYTIPNDADMSYVGCFIETAWTATPDPTNDLFDFYVDDVSVTVEAEEPGYGIIVNGGFENGSEPWAVQEASTLEIVTEEAFSGSYSAKISDRTNTASGPKQVLTGQLIQGQKVQVSAKVKYNDGPASKTFNFCIQCGDWRGIDVVGSVTAQKGQWATITGTYTIPNDADMSYVGCFIETAWTAAPDPTNDLFDFYVDDVSVVVLPDEKEPVEPGENDDNGSYLDLAWQWNHNPNNNDWSLTQRNGFLRLTTGTKAKNILEARNTLTQRTYGPTCSGNVALEIAGMKNGDVAGLAAFQQRYGYVGVKMENGTKYLVMTKTESDSDPNGTEVERVALDNGVNRVYLRVDFDYTQRKDQATFFYSLDGAAWTQIGNTLQMAYTMPHFMGYRFGLFNYATQTTGGYVDFDYFHVSDQGSNGSETVLNASLDDIDDVLGVAYAQVELPVKLDTLPDGDYTKLEASLNIPDDFTVSGVVFDEKNVTGEATYTYQDGRLVLTVSGDNVNYQDNGGTGFATVQLQLTDYTTQNKTVQVRTDYVRVTGGNVSYRVDNAVSNISLVKLDSEALAKIPGYSNPLIDYDFGADPFALEYNGRVYVYMTADQFEYDQNGNIIDNTYSKINSLHVISSADLVNWTDHGFIPVAGPNGVAKWANNSWAPAIAYKQIDGQDKFFLYFCNGGGGIGVLEGDSPVGPFTDPLGHALIDGSTPGTQGVPWIFDPAVMVDDDGTGYLVFGGGIPAGQDLNPKSARIVRLGDDMISLDCEPVMIDAPCMFEDGGIHKANGKYYYTYCSNFSGNHSAVEGYPGYGIICYMVSDDPLGPYEYCGEILQNPSTYFGVGGNNHHAIFNFKGTSYIVYHAQTLGQAMGIEKGYRSTHINEVEYYADGRIVPIQADREGISQLETMSPYQLTAGETIAWQAGIKVEACDQPGQGLSEVNNRAVTDIQNGDWIAVAGLDFGDKGAASFTASIAAQAGGAVELRVDSPDGTVVGTLTVPAGDGTYQTLTCDVTGLTGVHNLFMVFTGDDQAENLMSLDTWQFTEAGESASANKALLQATYDYAVNLDTTGVVQAAVDAFQKALDEAKAVLDNPNATQEQVNTAWDNLLEGIWGLGLKQGDKTMLELLIHRAEGMLPNESKYLPDHWQELLDALAAGQDVMEDGNALQGDVETAVDELLTAILAQRFKADKSILEDLIGTAQDMDLTGYTAESVATFRSALAAAQAVMADESLSEDDQQVVNDAVAALQSAMDGLTAEGDVQPSEKPQESQKPEQTQAPEATDQPQATQKPENVPQTGDSAQLMGYVAALTAAVGLLAGAAYVSRKRRS